jgi:hypothetical protein
MKGVREHTIPKESNIHNENICSLPVYESVQKKIDYFIETNKIPHIIFHGTSGTGKRTIVYNFLNRIYKNDKNKMKTNVMFVNCAHGKGIKFIREELKFFAKTNIQSNSGILFKTIVLMNADFLTIDAQSALRRCIELFSYSTRFFIIVENKNKLLNPILSRFCEIYVPEHIENGHVLNLHQYDLRNKMNFREHDDFKKRLISEKINKIDNRLVNHETLVELANSFYEYGLSCIDLMNFVEHTDKWAREHKTNFMMEFYNIKSEYRCEKLLMFYMLDFIYIRSKSNIKI